MSGSGREEQLWPADSVFPGEGVVELRLVMHAEQALAVEHAAHQCGLTAAQLLRRLIDEFLDRSPSANGES